MEVETANGTIVFVKVSVSRPVGSREVDPEEIAKEGVPTEFDARIQIFESPEYKAVCKADAEIGNAARKYSAPFKFAKGVHTVAPRSVPKITEKLEKAKSDWEEAKEKFIDAYPRIVKENQERLGPLALDETQYPTVEYLRRRFRASWQFMAIEAPGSLKAIDAELYREESEKIKSWYREARENVNGILAQEFKGVLDHLADMLKPSENGDRKRRIFKTLLPNVEEFLEALEFRMLEPNAELSKVADDLKTLVEGLPSERLKEDKVRELMAGAVADIQSSLESAIKDIPIRKFNR